MNYIPDSPSFYPHSLVSSSSQRQSIDTRHEVRAILGPGEIIIRDQEK